MRATGAVDRRGDVAATGVFFRAHAAAMAQKLGLVGTIRNTARNTVEGTLQGEREKLRVMYVHCAASRAAVGRTLPADGAGDTDDRCEWLAKTGSPNSVITRCEIRNERPIAQLEHDTFRIRH